MATESRKNLLFCIDDLCQFLVSFVCFFIVPTNRIFFVWGSIDKRQRATAALFNITAAVYQDTEAEKLYKTIKHTCYSPTVVAPVSDFLKISGNPTDIGGSRTLAQLLNP